MERTSGGVKNRRASALARLQAQLKQGFKTLTFNKAIANGWTKEEALKDTIVQQLSDSDIKRIEREIVSLESPKKKRKSNRNK